jgi:hypothetical protein
VERLTYAYTTASSASEADARHRAGHGRMCRSAASPSGAPNDKTPPATAYDRRRNITVLSLPGHSSARDEIDDTGAGGCVAVTAPGAPQPVVRAAAISTRKSGQWIRHWHPGFCREACGPRSMPSRLSLMLLDGPVCPVSGLAPAVRLESTDRASRPQGKRTPIRYATAPRRSHAANCPCDWGSFRVRRQQRPSRTLTPILKRPLSGLPQASPC